METRPVFEVLEPRQLASASLNTELVVNGGAEAGLGALDATQVAIPGWNVSSGPITVVQYGARGFLSPTDPGPTDRGKQFFSGGIFGPISQGSPTPLLSQSIDVSNLARKIDARLIRYDASAWLGGLKLENDHMDVIFRFRDANGDSLDTEELQGPKSLDRGGRSGLFKSSLTGIVPAGTREIEVTAMPTRQFGVVADGYADNISVKLSTVATTGAATGKVVNDTNGNGRSEASERGLAGVTMFVDTNNNKRLDAGELRTSTDTNGVYKLNGLKPGASVIRMVAPEGFRATTASSQTINARVGDSINAAPFALSQTAVISGKINWSDGQVFARGVVFDDLDNDGRLDANEPQTTANAKGEFQLTVKAGAHQLRVDRVTDVAALKVKVARGAFSMNNRFIVPPQ